MRPSLVRPHLRTQCPQRPFSRRARRDALSQVRGRPKSERERRVVEGLRGGVSMAGIARREGIPSRRITQICSQLLRAAGARGHRRIHRDANEPPERGVARQLRRNVRRETSGGRPGRKDRARTRSPSGGARNRSAPQALNSGAEADPSPVGEDESAEADCKRSPGGKGGERTEPKCVATRWKVSIREPKRRPPDDLPATTMSKAVRSPPFSAARQVRSSPD